MKKVLCCALTVLMMMLPLGALAESAEQAVVHQPDEMVESARASYDLLKEGNARYLAGTLQNKDTYTHDRDVLASGQKPFAVILTCADSRDVPEIYFDQKLGDLFTIRNAGNIADTTTIGSIQYAVEHLGTPLVVVVGHSSCGAVTSSFEGGEFPAELQSILDSIKPACDGAADVDVAIHNNLANMVETIRADEIVKESDAYVVGAYYDITTGEVVWINDAATAQSDAATTQDDAAAAPDDAAAPQDDATAAQGDAAAPQDDAAAAQGDAAAPQDDAAAAPDVAAAAEDDAA